MKTLTRRHDLATAANDHLLQIRVSDDFLEELDGWRGSKSPIPSRAEAIRVLVASSLKRER
jgi:hypothetical protein